MSISTRLILFLTIAVIAVLSVTSYSNLRRREAGLNRAMRSEVVAHAHTLQIALEELIKGGRSADAEHLVDRLSDNPYLFRVTLFDETGRVLILRPEYDGRTVHRAGGPADHCHREPE